MAKKATTRKTTPTKNTDSDAKAAAAARLAEAEAECKWVSDYPLSKVDMAAMRMADSMTIISDGSTAKVALTKTVEATTSDPFAASGTLTHDVYVGAKGGPINLTLDRKDPVVASVLRLACGEKGFGVMAHETSDSHCYLTIHRVTYAGVPYILTFLVEGR